MATFLYTAMDGQGRERKGKVDAATEAEASRDLHALGLFPTALAVGGPAVGRLPRAGRRAAPPQAAAWLSAGRPRIRRKALGALTRQVATLLAAGMPLVRSLRLLQRLPKERAQGLVLGSVADQVEGGQTLSEALATHPQSFDSLFISMVRAGEASGRLEHVLEKQAELLEKSRRLQRKVKAALTYPLVVCFIAMAITTGLMVFVVPKFATVFSDMMPGRPLPLLTRQVIGVSTWLLHRSPLLVLGIGAAVLAYNLVRRTRAGAYALDYVAARLPPFGVLVTLSASARFCQTLATLLQAGVPVLNALQIVRDTAGNRLFADAIAGLHDALVEGEALSRPMRASGVFPTLLVGMVEVGEETGALPEMLSRIAETYEEEVDSAVESLTALIEPAMIVFLAVVVGTIVIALFLPLITLISEWNG